MRNNTRVMDEFDQVIDHALGLSFLPNCVQRVVSDVYVGKVFFVIVKRLHKNF